MTLVEFLLARIAEDKGVAEDATHWSEGVADWGDAGEPDWEHIARWDPRRVLAECRAKRRQIEFVDLDEDAPWVLRYLALPYDDHPDYLQEWAP